MKKGLLVYRSNPLSNVFNIGDYIQSLAAMQFIGCKDVEYLNREELDLYTGEDIKLICNGWFMHSPYNWPPAPKIKPLFVAFHLNSSIKDIILSNEKNVLYLKKHEPIGCRDMYTVSLLKEKGIDAYFSGCLTLTLGLKYKSEELKSDSIYFVDVPSVRKISINSLMRCALIFVFDFKKLIKIFRRRFSKFSILNYIKNLFFVEQYSKIFSMEVLESAEYIAHEIQDSFDCEDAKFKYAEELLYKYAKAKFIVTSRIHCALPCLGLETPVLFIYNTDHDFISKCRFGGLLELFHVIQINKNRLISPYGTNLITKETLFQNKSKYVIYRDALINRCTKYVNEE